MRLCTLRIAPAEVDIKATSLDADLVERAPWCITAPDALLQIKPHAGLPVALRRVENLGRALR